QTAECFDLFFSALQRTRSAIVIDDLQGFDDTSVTLLNELITRGRSGEGQLVLLFSLNTDLTSRSSPFSALLQRVIDSAAASGGTSAPQFLSFLLEGFSPEDALSY